MFNEEIGLLRGRRVYFLNDGASRPCHESADLVAQLGLPVALRPSRFVNVVWTVAQVPSHTTSGFSSLLVIEAMVPMVRVLEGRRDSLFECM